MSTTFLLIAAESNTDYDANRTEIHLLGRDADRNRVHRIIDDYPPRFYVPTRDVAGRENDYLGVEGITKIDHDTGFDGFNTDEPLSRVTVQTARDKRNAVEVFPNTFGGDVNLNNWLRIEKDVRAWVEVPDSERISHRDVRAVEGPTDDPEPRIVTLDIEVDDRGGFPEPGEKRVTSIVAHDNYEGEYVGFIDGDGRPIEAMFPDGKPDEVDALHIEPDERRMLIRFASWVSERNPDMLTAWNVDFDAPYLIERMQKVNASPHRLSLLGQSYTRRDGTARIKGLAVYDLLDAYKNNSWSELRSYSLDYVAGEELGESKIHFEGSFWDLYQRDPATFINYNARDVRLAVEINETAGVISFRDTLRKQVGVNFEHTENNYQFVEMMCRRKLYERGEVGPTGEYGGNTESYEGAFVFPPHNGVARNVVGIDVESLYPWTMFSLNSSPETVIDEAEARENNVPFTKAPNGVCFRLDRDGLFKELVGEAIGLKEDYRDRKDNAVPDSDEQAMWAERYAVAKTVTNSIYGVIGWSRFFLYHKPTAEAVTLAGQAVIKNTASYVNENTAADVIYGDTDSNYISFPEEWGQEDCIQAALDICEELEGHVYPGVATDMGIPPEDCEWRIGPEMYAPRFLQWGKKKKYAYITTWKEGMEPDAVLDDPSITIKGSAAKRSDSSRLTRDTEKAVMKAILNGDDDAVSGIVYEAAKKIDPDDPAWNEIGIPGGIRKELYEYESPTAHVRAAQYANELCGTEFASGSKPMRCYIRPAYFDSLDDEIDVIAYEDSDDLAPVKDRLTVDAGRMTDTLLVNPLGDVLDAVGVDVESAVQGQTQTGLGAFL